MTDRYTLLVFHNAYVSW